ncbi:hypothetical protein NHJ6243_008149 [Beauveria neobassiana]
MAGDRPNSGLIESLSAVNSSALKDLRDRFHQLSHTKQDLRLFCFYETEQSNTAMKNDKGEWKMNGPKVMALSVTSARHCPQSEFNDGCVCAIPRSHSDIVKFEANDAQYDKVRTILEAMARDTTESNSDVPLTKDEKECMRALWFSSMDNRSVAIGPATPGTCTWVLKESTYKQWSSADRGLFWMKGHPGVGKSTLIKFIMEEIKRTRYVDKMRSIVVSFFFNKRAADDLEKTRLGFYRSVLHQLLDQCPEALGGLVTSFSRRKDTSGQVGKDWYWQEQNLGTNLAHAICSILDSHALWLFVDALDESNEGTADTMVREFKLLLKINPSSHTNFHICFTARHFPVIATDCDFELQVDQKNVDDIKKYVLEEFSNRCQQLSNSEIPKTVITGAHGIFLWARVALEEAIRLHHSGRGLPFIVQALKRLPPELQDLFRSIIISGAEEVSSLQVMQWICFAEEDLTLEELRWAIIVDDDESKLSVADCRKDPSFIADDDGMTRRLRALSCGLAEVVEARSSVTTSKRIQFIHETVKEFFLNHGLRLLRGTDVGSDSDSAVTTARERKFGHYRLARTCIRYLAIVDLSSYTAKALSKAEVKRIYHFEGQFLRKLTEWQGLWLEKAELQERERVFKRQFSVRDLYIRREEVNDLVREDLPFLPYALRYWMPHVEGCERISTGKDDILHYSLWPKEDLFKQVNDLSHHIMFSVSPWTTILHLAAEHGFLERLQVTLAQAGDGQSQINTGNSKGQTPLQLATRNGHDAAVRMLLDTGKVDVNARDHRQASALLMAAERGHVGIVRTLLRGGETPSIFAGKSTIFPAAAQLYHSVVGNASDTARKVDLDSRDWNGKSALLLAAEKGHLRVVKDLLDIGKVDVNSKNDLHESALLSATRHGTLFSRDGVDVNAKSVRGDSAIMLAAKKGYSRVVKALLDTGKVDVRFENMEHQSALMLASGGGHIEVVKILLSYDGVGVKNCDEDSAIMLAAKNGHFRVVEALLDTGKVDVSSKSLRFKAALWLASQRGHLDVVKILLDRGRADVNLRDTSSLGMPVLLYAIEEGHLELVQLLVDIARLSVNSKHGNAGSAISLAIRKENLEIISYFLNSRRISELSLPEADVLSRLGFGKVSKDTWPPSFECNETFDRRGIWIQHNTSSSYSFI